MTESWEHAHEVLWTVGWSQALHGDEGQPVRELSDSKWLCDLAFMVDITQYLSEMNIKLQGPQPALKREII